MATMRMRADVKQAWVQALRSGEYRQGRGKLTRVEEDGSESFCCLGVLCDVAIKMGAPFERVTVDVTNEFGQSVADNVVYQPVGNPVGRSGAVLPEKLVEWTGMTETEALGTYYPDDYVNPNLGGRDSLAELNDGNEVREPWTFEQIADLIEREIEGV